MQEKNGVMASDAKDTSGVLRGRVEELRGLALVAHVASLGLEWDGVAPAGSEAKPFASEATLVGAR